MCEIRLSGLTRIEECRLRFELSREDDPFVDAEVALSMTLAETIALLQRVQAAVGEAPAQPRPNEKAPKRRLRQSTVAPAAPRAPGAAKAPTHKNTRWKQVVDALCAGDLDVFTRREKSAAAASTVKWQLGKTFPGLDVLTEASADGSILLSVRQGKYGVTKQRRAA